MTARLSERETGHVTEDRHRKCSGGAKTVVVAVMATVAAMVTVVVATVDMVVAASIVVVLPYAVMGVEA